MKNTKGPWKATDTTTIPWGTEKALACTIEVNSRQPLALVILEGPYVDDCILEEGEANARLIAAAPEMLNALFSAYDLIKNELGYGSVTEEIEKAIKKAKGES